MLIITCICGEGIQKLHVIIEHNYQTKNIDELQNIMLDVNHFFHIAFTKIFRDNSKRNERLILYFIIRMLQF